MIFVFSVLVPFQSLNFNIFQILRIGQGCLFLLDTYKMGGIGSKLEEIQEFEEAQQEMEKQEVIHFY